MKSTNIPAKPFAPTPEDQARWEHTALRRRIIQGKWSEDLSREMLKHFSTDRYMVMGPPDLSTSILSQITRQLAVLYHEAPTITHTDQDISDLVGRDGIVTLSGLWSLQQRAQQMTLALREVVIRIDVVAQLAGSVQDISGLQYRIVTGDYLYMEASDDAPDEPLYYQELRLRVHPESGDPIYVADVLDIKDPDNPRFGLYEINQDGSLGADVSELFLGTPARTGKDYPYRSKDGKPFLPIQVYRAEKTGLLWNSFDQSTITYGTLITATLMSWWVHLMRDCSWSQKYVAGMTLAGQNVQDGDSNARRATVSTDPSSILVFHTDPEVSGQPLIGQFQPPADPLKMIEAIAHYEYKCVTAAGISSSVLRQSGDPRSGYSLSVSRDGQREAARMHAPVQRRYDELLLSKSAMLCNAFLGTSLPETGYRVQYATLPKSPEEMKAERENITGLLNAGLLSPVQAIQMLHSDLDTQEAREMLLQIRRDKAEFI